MNNNNFPNAYHCNGKKYHNIYQAFDESIKSKDFIHYRISEDFLRAVSNVKINDITTELTHKLIIDKLKWCRKKYNKIVLSYSGGLDSTTILQLAMENKIYIDTVFTQLPSLTGDETLNAEYLPGVNYAKQFEGTLIGEVVVQTITTDDLEFHKIPNWYKDPSMLTGDLIPLRPWHRMYMLKPYYEQDGIVIVGLEKPQLRYKDGKFYRFVLDAGISDAGAIPNIFHFYLDANDPSLFVAMTLHFRNQFGNDLSDWRTVDDRKEFIWRATMEKINKAGYRYASEQAGLQQMSKNPFDGKSLKNRLFVKELYKLGRADVYESYMNSHNEIKEQYQPHGLVDVQDGITKAVGRYSQFLTIHENYLEYGNQPIQIPQ